MKKQIDTYLKAIGAIILLLSLTMPLSSCDRRVDQQGKVIPILMSNRSKPLPPGTKIITKYNYFIQDFDINNPYMWLLFFGYIWPPFMILAINKVKKYSANLAYRIVEIILIAGSIYSVLISCLFARLEVGAYAAFTGAGVYSIGACWSDIKFLLAWKQEVRGRS